MTLISNLSFNLEVKAEKKADNINFKEISIVIPVRNNQNGINSLLTSFFRTHKQKNYPKEFIIVDNNSNPPIEINSSFLKEKIDFTLKKCRRKGPASARNIGVKASRGKWILFLDSDCEITKDTISGYLKASNRSIGYAGSVKSLGKDLISKYYEDQEILMPLKTKNKNEYFVPQYLITANCMVWKKAFMEVGGFNEKIQIAGGEDIDIGLRLSEIGNLEFAFDSIVYHNFDDGLIGFWNRFLRYGQGNRIIEEIYQTDLSPKIFRPNKRTIVNEFLAKIQWLGLKVGYNLMNKKIKTDANIAPSGNGLK